MDVGGDYIFSVKENQPRLYQNIQQLFTPEYPKPGFGKITTDFSAATHGKLESPPVQCSTTTSTGRDWDKFIEYGIASFTRSEATPLQILQHRRAHWYIETGLHYRRDVILREDATRLTTGDMGSVMASINNLILARIKQAGFHNAAQDRRWFAGHLERAFELLTTHNSQL